MSTPAGWYPDPEAQGSQRYWDGNQWTEHRAAATQPAATAFAQQPAAAPAGKSIWSRWYVWAGIVLLGLIVIGAIASSGGNKTPAASSPSSPGIAPTQSGAPVASETPEAPPADPGPEAAGIGTPVRDGKFEFTVNSMKCGVKSVGNNVLGSKAQGQYCLINLSVSNIGDEPQTMFDGNQKVLDGQGREFSADTAAAIYANPSDSQVFIEEINPGNSIRGTLVFDVPKNVKPTQMELHDSAFSGGVTVSLS